MTAEQGMTAPAPKKSGAFKWLLIGGVGCLLVMLLLGGGCIGTIFFALSKAKDSQIYKQSLQQAQANPQVQAALGTPIEGGTPTQFNFNYNNGVENGNIVYAVQGPKGSGTVTAAGSASGGTWTFTTLAVNAGGQNINLLVQAPPVLPPVENAKTGE